MDSAAAGEPFYVVRKGDVIGIYKTLSECQAQVSNSVSALLEPLSVQLLVVALFACSPCPSC